MIKTFFFPVILTFGFLSCGSPETQIEEETPKESEVKISDSEIEISDVDSVELEEGVIEFDESRVYTVELLTVGVFHAEEVSPNVQDKLWFGIFKNQAGHYLAETKLKTKRVEDGIVDEPGEKTAWKVKTVNKDTSIMLISGLDFLRPHFIREAIPPITTIYPGDTLSITHLGVDYQYYATGRKDSIDGNQFYLVSDYKLYLESKSGKEIKKTLLVDISSFDDAMVYLIFAGDIDGDGLLDLIIDKSRHYNGTMPTLFLSKPAEKGQTLKEMGSHLSVGC